MKHAYLGPVHDNICLTASGFPFVVEARQGVCPDYI
jgi:hypothetical protein